MAKRREDLESNDIACLWLEISPSKGKSFLLGSLYRNPTERVEWTDRFEQFFQLELSASNTVKVHYRLPVTCSDFNSTTVNSLGLDFIDLLPVTLSISYRCLNVVSNTDFYAICSHYYHFSNRIVTNIILL